LVSSAELTNPLGVFEASYVFKKLSYLYMDTVKIVCCLEFSPEFELNYVIM